MTRPGLRRPAGTEQRATWLELFYDLVFLFAVTQVSHHLLADHIFEELREHGLEGEPLGIDLTDMETLASLHRRGIPTANAQPSLASLSDSLHAMQW